MFLVLLLLVVVGGCSNGRALTASAATDGSSSDSSPVKVRWFVGLGTGSQEEQISAQKAVVDEFNSSHRDITLELEIVDNLIAEETLSQEIADGDAPDIIGPVGMRGSVAFGNQFLDLTPYIEEMGFDLSAYDSQQVEFWREPDGRLSALPFGVFPSFIYYNKKLFDRAGLSYPPHTFDGTVDGKPWTTDELYEMAQLLTLDANGNNATSSEFDSTHIVQWGLHLQYVGDARAQGTLFGSGTFVSEDGSAQIPQNWLREWQWYHDLVWKARAAPNQREIDSALLDEGNTFHSGNVAMVFSHLWYTGSLKDETGKGDDFFDIGVVPSYQGEPTSKLHADTFRILAATKHPAESFVVLSYLLSDAAPTLLETYGSLPARVDLRAPFFGRLDEMFSQGVDWSVVELSLTRPDTPSHECGMPNFAGAQDRIDTFSSQLATDPNMDVSLEADRLRQDLSSIFSQTMKLSVGP